MTRITTVIFDMYETLVQNQHHLWEVGFKGIIQEQSLDVSPQQLWQEWAPQEAEFRGSRIKPGEPFRSYFEAWRDAFRHTFARLDVPGDAEAAAASFVSYISHRDPYPETVEALTALRSEWRIALLSNADDDYLLPNLEYLGLDFEAVLSSEQARVYKPLPELFRRMLQMLDVAPEESVYVGDQQFEDVQGAGSVGMHAIWVNRTGAPPDPDIPAPAFQVRNLLELPGLLKAWPPTEDNAR